MKTFFSIFLFLKKNRMPWPFNSCAVSQNKGRFQFLQCKAWKNTIHPECQCKFRVLPLARDSLWAAVVCRVLQWETTILRHGWWPFFSFNCKNEAPLCSRESLSFIIQMKWGPADGGRGAAGLWLKTSCSLPLWFQSARDEIKSSKGISNRDGSH